jgi:hypothetical protein
MNVMLDIMIMLVAYISAIIITVALFAMIKDIRKLIKLMDKEE